MDWPVEWLWIAVIVAVAMLVFVGVFLGSGFPVPSDNTAPASTPIATASSA